MDIMEWTPLMHAARNGEVETVQKLLKSKEKIHLKNMMGANLLTLSAASGNKSVFKMILGEMKNMSAENTVDLSCGLRVAALFGHTDIVQFILNAKCDPNAKDPVSGATALMLATSCGHYSVVRLILAYGALVDSTNVFCQSAIDIAESKQYNDLVELLKTKIEHDSKKFRPNFLMPLEMPKMDYRVKELDTVSGATDILSKTAASPTANKFNFATEELLSPQTTYMTEVPDTGYLSPMTSLQMCGCETYSPGDSIFLSENQACKKTDDKTKQIVSQPGKAVEMERSSNDVRYYLSPHNYHFPKKFEVPKKQEFSRNIEKSIQEEKFQDNFELSYNKMFQYDTCSQPSSPYSPSPNSLSPTSRNVFSRSDPSVIHELNGGTERQKRKKKAFWHVIRRRVRSLAHDKNGYHFYHPYCDSAVSKKNTISSPRIWMDDNLKFKSTEANPEGEKEESTCKMVVSPLSSNVESEKSYKNTPISVQKERPVKSEFKEFLCANGLHHFIDILFEHELDLETFFELRDMDLREIGITSTEDRRKILNIIASQSRYCT
ncbi:uncharacterized protein LOC126191587 isoform X1 [Schistocerca cancellata]|uniref:uncharacterized protein LOC126191587 isoform X1 n=1 Tax=Schistocerca cancellata TaxID=274614 RepID=UPI002117891D|nr:uncharacterized protein LOC126191587 isoform X1 [Schistocerca cancellata]XP_049788481.1 uncharacterized protein LOC126191587 isoform X1 [Schistocerca cancellata]XP_049788483.1 uncharacterized protein LOC126191587 isoform X1 [Schistocerca cancellata]XP_049788484.1 uncharacterized protein LOC126191587 isoform X1 [Schistocerca cancellata]XP_049788485.1 uncharacterized protein LOC126191587 isoform X1 [Schistocerca cancellata]XP_049788486.1 uncharacterized protein LOC126191587 isoform X1 [Schist